MIENYNHLVMTLHYRPDSQQNTLNDFHCLMVTVEAHDIKDYLH